MSVNAIQDTSKTTNLMRAHGGLATVFGGRDQCHQQHHNCCFPFFTQARHHRYQRTPTLPLHVTSRSFFFQQKMAKTIPRHLIDVDVSEAARADRKGISAKKRIATFLSIITPSRSKNTGCGLLAQDSLRGISNTDFLPSRAPLDDLLAAISKSPIANQTSDDTADVFKAD